MNIIVSPSLSNLRNLLHDAHDRLSLFSPFVTDGPLELLVSSIRRAVIVEIWTRLSPTDWASGVSDPEFLSQSLDKLARQGHQVSLRIHPRLHAKAYFADDSQGLIGSANLTNAAFSRNVEVLIAVGSSDVRQARKGLEQALSKAKDFELSDLREWVEGSRGLIEKVHGERDKRAEQLAESQRDLDRRLGFGSKPPRLAREPGKETMEGFISWLKSNTKLREAQMVIDRYNNYQFLSGKAKQSICASFRFLTANPKFVAGLSREARKPSGPPLYSPDEEITESWIDHVNEHATDSGDCYDYSVLRGYLTPMLGGTLTGGTGGESTLKRVLPLMALYIRQKGM
jgi:HKD family nuclease